MSKKKQKLLKKLNQMLKLKSTPNNKDNNKNKTSKINNYSTNKH